eukprot:714812_1
MALKLFNTIVNKSSKKPKVPPLSTKSEDDEKAPDSVEKYHNGQVVDKQYTDQMGKHENIQIPKWMQKDAPIPAHIKNLKCEKFSFPKDYYRDNRWAVLIRNVFSKEECNDLIKFTESQGYEEALVNIGYGRQKKMPEFRNCKRMMIDNWDMVNCLWSRVQQFIPKYFDQRKKISFNERLRFLRYYKGEFFAPHYDGTYVRENGEISKLTFLLYLNDGFKGGKTRFLQNFMEENYHAPKICCGMVVMFQHDIYHEGAILEDGVKYIVRTDVMYTNKIYKQVEIVNDKENNEIEYVEYTEWKNDGKVNESEDVKDDK